MLRLTCRINGVQTVRSVIGKKTPVYVCFILFSIVFLGIVFALISQLNMITADQGMSKMSANMSGMQGMSGVLGISSNEESIFLEWMFIAIAGLVGVPFAWVIIRERRKNSNRTKTVPKYKVDKI